jgi:ubiquinone/menaquinone biosynthesis C-methylase UbiE
MDHSTHSQALPFACARGVGANLRALVKGWLKKSPVFNFNQVERDRWVRRQAAGLPAQSAVLDLGAGTGPYRQFLSHCSYKTQDFSALTPEQLRDYKGYGSIDYVCDATAIPVPDNHFDVVLCTEVLEHVPEPIKVIEEIARVLKPGGKLLLTAPLCSGIHQEPYHFYGGYTPYWYQKFLTRAGFLYITIEPNGGFFKHYGQESVRFAKMLTPWKASAAWPLRLLLLPAWLISIPWFVFGIPLACQLLDRLDAEKKFTIGYHVIAIRGPVGK